MQSPRIDLQAVSWRKSSYSNPDGGDCLEVADNIPTAVPVRDSKNPGGPALVFGAAAWAAFVSALKEATAQAHPMYGSKSQ
ncbi:MULTISPECIES: DUF397 domain-containing protein [Streptomyces]|uniref:DUF397 domain-containing protein n=1 Tax=Streptomyces griseocarneus TaxID=51201 RepID=A0ABX7RV08_9ACTN|nr:MULTISPECIES: DUF397 domain-containing protein [Streptomyces]QSY51089.1 DUF397 domain-containing protein [Streptomyces griseocarneus]